MIIKTFIGYGLLLANFANHNEKKGIINTPMKLKFETNSAKILGVIQTKSGEFFAPSNAEDMQWL